MSQKNRPNLGDRPSSPAPGSDPGQTQPGAPFHGGTAEEENIFPDQEPGPEGGRRVRTPGGRTSPEVPASGERGPIPSTNRQ